MLPPSALAPGTIFANDFRIVRPLAEGGMGVVYVVEQLSTRSMRALKLMQRELVQSPQLRERFEQEAQLPSRIASEHVAKVLGAGVDVSSGLPWFAMELLEGETLDARVERGAPLSTSELLTIFEEVCHALSAAHREGIVHRDLKPENVFLAKRHGVGAAYTTKILDFGIARVVAAAATTSTGVMGTPIYMAPEQYQGRGIRPQTDVWALGLIFFYAVARRAYWRGGESGEYSAASLMYETCHGDLSPGSVRAHELGTSFPAELDEWLSRCVVREVEQRFSSAEAAIESLRGALSRLSTAPRRIERTLPVSEPPAFMSAATAPPVSSTVPRSNDSGKRARGAKRRAAAPAEVNVDSAEIPKWTPPRRPAKRGLSGGRVAALAIVGLGALGVVIAQVGGGERGVQPPPAASAAAVPSGLAAGDESGSAPAASDESTSPIPVSDADPQWGDADALVTLVEFSEFQCPFCARVQPTLAELRTSYGSRQLRMVWKNMPLPFHDNARPAAEAAMSVFSVGGSAAFWKFHDLAFANQVELSPTNFASWAQSSGANGGEFATAQLSNVSVAKIDEDLALAARLGVTGTPAFRINGATLSGAQPIEAFKKVIDEALAEAQALVSAGVPRAKVYAAASKARLAREQQQQATDTIGASHVLIQYKGALRAGPNITRSKDEAKLLATGVLNEAKKGQDFAALAKKYSDEPNANERAGALGTFTRTQMVKPFSDAAFALKPGEISDVVETDFGFHVIKRTE